MSVPPVGGGPEELWLCVVLRPDIAGGAAATAATLRESLGSAVCSFLFPSLQHADGKHRPSIALGPEGYRSEGS